MPAASPIFFMTPAPAALHLTLMQMHSHCHWHVDSRIAIAIAIATVPLRSFEPYACSWPASAAFYFVFVIVSMCWLSTVV